MRYNRKEENKMKTAQNKIVVVDEQKANTTTAKEEIVKDKVKDKVSEKKKIKKAKQQNIDNKQTDNQLEEFRKKIKDILNK
jgi:hypothetical protein